MSNEPSISKRLKTMSNNYEELKNLNRSHKMEVANFQLECQQMRNQLLKLKKESDFTYNLIQTASSRKNSMQQNFSNLQHSVQSEIQIIMGLDQQFIEQKKQTAYINQQIAECKNYVQQLCDERENLNSENKQLIEEKQLFQDQKKELFEHRTRLVAQLQKQEGHLSAVRAKMQ
ncbi:hypothetical protein SS50377_23349 [Spironucleus salmonicida]|uniref:Uncharacterized protein n=1 Tax=Spironucleus salmonicida TaxID=348837 RepID=V6LSK6_9EUKA|nr:hypothetical protein SS50377_23349 [Spironucleus salmonicida]|eukprot:EST47218.1 Hypothetical protein SS50377_12729 [Spironucleus salmonicida]